MNISKNIWKVALAASALCMSGAFTSCDDYLDVLPKGKKIPVTYADYFPMLSYEYGCGQQPIYGVNYLMNAVQRNKSLLTTNDVERALYMWDESADRITLTKSDESFYYNTYGAINCHNLIIEKGPVMTECSDAQRQELMSYARTLRAYAYYNLVNYYADIYDAKSAESTRGIPMIYSADVDAPYKQESVGFIYKFIVDELSEVIKSGSLPDKSLSVLHPDRTAAHAILAKVYLTMGEYAKALTEAETVLKTKDALIDWNAVYASNKDGLDNPTNYATISSVLNHSCVENILYVNGDNSPNYDSNEKNMTEFRMAGFEEGDNHFKCRWKLRSTSTDTYGQGMMRGYFNKMGIRTVEMYYIKAECLARAGKIEEAMTVLNDVRKKHIDSSVYSPLRAVDLKDALGKIIKSKDNMMVMSLVPFIDMKRLNKEGLLVRTLTKTVDGKEYTLKPDSHLWTMVFPAGAVKNHGGGIIEQNSK